MRTRIAHLLMTIVVVGLGVIPGAASAKDRFVVSSTVGGTNLANAHVLSGTVAWTATPSGAQASRVEFFIDGASRWTENFAPYRFNGDPDGMLDTTTLANGKHQLVVVAHASNGATAVAKRSVRVSNKPRVPELAVSTNIADGSTLGKSLTWVATARGTPVLRMEFLIDGASRWTENFAPYRFNGDPDGMLDTTTLTNGPHTLAVVAHASGGETAVARASVTVSNVPPFTTSSSVENGSTLSGSLVWTAAPSGASVEKVEFLIDGLSRWTENYSPYRFNGDPSGMLDTTTLTNGTHTLSAVAHAVDGRTATTRSVVTISNQPISENKQRTYPDAPTDLHATDTSQQTSLTAAWTAVAGATGYRVGRNGVPLTDTVRTSYTWIGLVCGTPYTLSVQPETSTSDIGGRIATVSATTAACAPFGSGSGERALFTGDFESGNISPWTGAQCLNNGLSSDSDVTRGDLYVVNDVVAKGTYGGRFDLPASSTRSACELLRRRSIAMDEEWYSMEIRLPNNWREPSSAGWGMSLAQLNFENIWGAPVSVAAHGNFVDLTLNSGLCTVFTSSNPSCQYSSGVQGSLPQQHIIPSSAFSTGTWHQLLIHVKWTTGNDGVLEGFHRLRGESAWTKTVELRGYPTLQRTSTYTPVASDRTADKIGAYRGIADFPVSVWQDNFCQATSRAAAEACF